MQKIKELVSKWWLVLILGIISVICGFIIVSNPGTGFMATKFVLVIDFITIGILSVAYVIGNRDKINAWGWDLVLAILVLIMGLMIAVIPGLSEMFILVLFSCGFVFEGAFGIKLSILLKKNEVKGWGWVLALGIITVIAGLICVFNPITAALTIDILTAVAMFSHGAQMIALSIKMSKLKGSIKKVEKKVAEAKAR